MRACADNPDSDHRPGAEPAEHPQGVRRHRRHREFQPRPLRPARWWRWSATTAPASRRSSRSSPACTRRPPAQSCSTARTVHFTDPSQSQAHGIQVVYQDLALADSQPVYMNLFLGRETMTGPFRRLDRRRHDRRNRDTGARARRPHPVGDRDHPRPLGRPAPGRRHRARHPLGDASWC